MYHEKQVRQMCLVHALNNLVQEKHFTSADIDSICYDLNESRWLNPHRSMLGFCNFDVNVLMVALERLGFNTQWFDTRLDASRIAWPLVQALIFNVPSPSFIQFYRGRPWYTALRPEDNLAMYHEKQVRQMCLVHALNNLVQEKHFTSADIDSICYDLNESRWLNPHRSMLGAGNYDVNVLMVALERLGFKVEARKELESYAYWLKNNEKLGGKHVAEKKTIEEAVDEAISWLGSNADASVEDLQEQKKDLEGKAQPIISKLYKDGAAPEGGEATSDEKDEL